MRNLYFRSFLAQIKNILFDLGGVLLPLRMEDTAAAFAQLGIPSFKSLYNSYQGVPFMEEFETGRLNEEEFVAHLLRLATPGTRPQQATDAWNTMLGHFEMDTIRLLQALAGRYRLFLYSNTNSIHYRVYQASLHHLTGLPGLEALFERAYFSHLLGHRKPNPEGFMIILHENGLQPSETLFIDDGAIHIATAQKLGLPCYRVSAETPLEAIDWNNPLSG